MCRYYETTIQKQYDRIAENYVWRWRRCIHRVLKPNGEIVIIDWCKDFWVCKMCDWVLQRLDLAHQKRYTQAELYALTKAAGFRISQARRIRFA